MTIESSRCVASIVREPDGDMEKFVEQSLLYDFYGVLLTEHQRRLYEETVFQDLSLSEIAQQEGISRQGVHDLIKRCNASLQEYESRLHLVERFIRIRENVREIDRLAGDEERLIPDTGQKASLLRIRQLSNEILEEL